MREIPDLDLAFLGCGAAAGMHSRTLSSLREGVRLHFASRDRENSESFRKRYGGVRAYDAYEKALEEASVDVVFVTTPPDRHLDLTLAALEAGKDVIVEKPAFLRTRDFGVVRERATRSGKRVLVAENYYYKPLRARLQDILTRNLIGEPLFLHLNAVKHQEPRGWRSRPEEAGGGGLFEGGIHWLNLVSNLGLEVEEVAGYRAGDGSASGPEGLAEAGREAGPPEVDTLGPGKGTAESILAVLRFRGGCVATLAFSWEVPSPLKGVRFSRIYGRKGTVLFESNGLVVVVQGPRPRLYMPGIRDLAGYRRMLRDFLRALRTGEEPQMTLEKAQRDVDLVHQIYRSAGA